MRILLLNLYYPPDTGATAAVAHDFARALAEEHDVTVVAGRPSYNLRRKHPYYLFRRERLGRIKVERVGSSSFHRRRMSGRMTNFVSYLAFAFIRAMVIHPRPDVIIAMTDPPLTSLVAVLVAMIRRCRLVYNVQDLHPDMALAAGVVSPGLFVSLWMRLHHWVLKRANLVVVVGQDMLQRIVAKGVPRERVVVVRDGASPLSSPSTPDNAVAREIRGMHQFVVVHAGNLGFAGAWDNLLEAARRLEPQGVGLVFVGDGALRPELEQMAKGQSNVRFLPYYPSEELPQVLASADLHVVTVRRGLEGLFLPSKLYPILMAGRPVLAVTPPQSDVAQIVREYGCGLVADPDDPQEVADLVSHAASSPGLLKAMGERARVASRAFCKQRELKRFVGLVESTVNDPIS